MRQGAQTVNNSPAPKIAFQEEQGVKPMFAAKIQNMQIVPSDEMFQGRKIIFPLDNKSAYQPKYRQNQGFNIQKRFSFNGIRQIKKQAQIIQDTQIGYDRGNTQSVSKSPP